MSVPASVEIGATGLRGLAQEIRTALATRKGSVPLDRDFGLSWELIDLPLPESRPLLVAEIGRGLERCVPRIKVKSVTFRTDTSGAADGKLTPVVTVEIREGHGSGGLGQRPVAGPDMPPRRSAAVHHAGEQRGHHAFRL